ncbi:MAG: TonB-dependent receptor [Deltaproteobacteria bacterium]|nr:TonB-dependent receptor [Deltaproteobacteria bacterium]
MDRGSYSVKGGEQFPRTSAGQKNLMAEFGYAFAERHRIGVSFSKRESDSEFPSISFREIPVLHPAGTPFTPYNEFRLTQTSYGLTYDGATQGGTFDWSVFFTRSEYRRIARYNDYLFGQDDDLILQDVYNYGGAIGYNGGYVDIDLGFDFSRYKIRADYEGDNVFNDFGVYLSSKVRLFDDRLFVSLGARFDDVDFRNRSPDGLSRSETNFAKSFGIAYIPAEWLKLRANYSEGFRMPTAWEFLGGVSGQYPYLPNPGLKPERSKTFEFGFDAYWRFFSSSVTYFSTVWKDRIEGTGYPVKHVNLKQSETAGLEIALKADLGEAFDAGFQLEPYVNLTYMTKRRNKDEYYISGNGNVDTMPNVPKWTLSYGVTFRHPGIDLMANANAVHVGPTYYWKFSNVALASSPVWRGSDFVALDLSLEKGLWEIGRDGRYGKLKLRVEAKNLLDSNNEIYYDYPGPGRNFYVGLKYEY